MTNAVMTRSLKRKGRLAVGWEKSLVDKLLDLGIVDTGFTGKLSLTLHQGGVTSCELGEKLK